MNPRSALRLSTASLGLFLLAAPLAAQERVTAGPFVLQFDRDGITSLRHANDKYGTEFIAPKSTLGHLTLRYRMGENDWRTFSTRDGTNKVQPQRTAPGVVEHHAVYNPSEWNDYYADLELMQRFRVEGDALYWTIHPRNLTHKPIQLGDVVLPLPFNTEKRWDKAITYTQRLIQRRFVSGHNSFVYWMRANSEGPYLVMVPVSVCPLFEPNRIERNFTPARLEFFQGDSVYIHSGRAAEEAKARGGTWRQPQTSHTLPPKFTPNDEVTWVFKFRWAADYDGVRNILYEEGLIDTHVAPGMTVPQGLDAMVSLRTKSPIKAVEAEFPQQTKVEYVGERGKDNHVYKVTFGRLGENRLTVRFGRNQYTVLEFFASEPVATLIRKRSAFLVNNQQHRDPAKWYNGLFSEWDMRAKVLRSPDDTGGLLDYIVASDDPGLCKAPFVAGKNVEYPDAKEIAAVEYYLEHFVWGKLQMTEAETYPYAVYGIDNWKKNRDAKPADRDGWVHHLWRVFDYPHVVHLYWNMYRVAKYYPELARYLDKDGYLQRAYGTAMAYYTVPMELAGWPAHDVGNYDELVIAEVIDELDAAGWKDKADALRAQWEGKVRHFVKERPNLFHSEYPFDPTGFESHHALARYAVAHAEKPEATLRVTRAEADDFMKEQMAGNIATRGWLETSYWQLGVEGSMRYMSQMGGWAIVDYALYHAADPVKYLRLGYASILSSWALMNTGTAESGHGFWYPARENDGAAGSAYQSQPFGRSWIGIEQARGVWPYSAEIDLGFGGALRAAATVVADDPLFGLLAYGGRLTRQGTVTDVVPLDGMGRRFHILRDTQRVHLLLDRNGLAAGQPVRFDDALKEMSLTVENRAPEGVAAAHETELRVSGLPAGSYQVTADGRALQTISGSGTWQRVMLPTGGARQVRVGIRRID